MQKHKNDLISKLEGKTSAMAETLRKLDDKYVIFSQVSCFTMLGNHIFPNHFQLCGVLKKVLCS